MNSFEQTQLQFLKILFLQIDIEQEGQNAKCKMPNAKCKIEKVFTDNK